MVRSLMLISVTAIEFDISLLGDLGVLFCKYVYHSCVALNMCEA